MRAGLVQPTAKTRDIIQVRIGSSNLSISISTTTCSSRSSNHNDNRCRPVAADRRRTRAGRYDRGAALCGVATEGCTAGIGSGGRVDAARYPGGLVLVQAELHAKASGLLFYRCMSAACDGAVE
eukprot:scaffold5178_cov364-Prasinococcus_capsulatus_cf.AAC.14